MDKLLLKLLNLLYECFVYDVEVFAQPWIYWWLCIPAACYFAFFMVKWMVLLFPFRGPPTIVLIQLARAWHVK